MLKMLKKLFKRNLINNDKGSALSVAFIVITVLTFSLTTVTSMNVNLAGATTLKIEQVTDDSLVKALIRQAIGEFEDYIEATDSYEDFNNVEIPRILTDYGVVVSDVTGTGDFVDYAGTDSYVYKFAITMDDGDVLYKYVFSSIYGSSVETFDVFDYSLGTNGKLILNSGLYDEVYLYGEEVKLASTAPYVVNGSTTQAETPNSSATYPTLTTSGPSTIFSEVSYDYCISSCFTLNGYPNPFVINESNYVPVVGSDLPDQGTVSTMIINDFFGNFDYDEFFIDYLKTKAPKEDETITEPGMTMANAKATILSYADDLTWTTKNNGTFKKWVYPSTPFVNITTGYNTHPSEFDFTGEFSSQGNQYSLVYDGDLVITSGVSMDKTPTIVDSLIIFGDLTLDGGDIQGAIVVFGDLYITGDTQDYAGTLFILGQTFINKDLNAGITTNGNDYGFTIIAKDNVIIEEIYENHVSSALATQFSAFIYTEESIYIDAVNSRLNIEGALFARGLGVSGNQIFMDDESISPINGIIINSYRGYINNSGVAVPSTSNTANGFIIEKISSGNYQDRFYNIPVFESLVQIPGLYTFETSEWLLE
ncbi:MAG: hypothetical protein KQ78_01399 [Candidatus Izimaplasma bacterium HR2]|nr:MAG: hypothetical protein KQ78_01399 [Candidatus Izimaplasma bacterium HR2]